MSAESLITQHLDTWTQAIETKSTAGRGSSNKLNLVGIQKLRELILEMAVRGLLVPQDPNDEPASVLLEKIAAEKAQLIKDGKIKKAKVQPKITEDEKLFNVPNGWAWVRLGEVGRWAIGSGFPKKIQGTEGAEILFSKVSDMNLEGNEKYLIATVNTITNDIAVEHKLKIHQNGTVIFPKIGGAIATNKRRILVQPTVIDNNCLGITPTVGITTDYLYLYLQSLDLTEYQAGTSVPALSQSVLDLITLGLPPLEEQRRIVTKVDELMVLCDQLESQTLDSIAAHQTLVETLLGNLVNPENTANFDQAWSLIAQNFDVLFTTEHSIDTLKQTILQLAVMGKLVPQNPSNEPASELLKKIATEKAQLIADKKIKKSKPLPPITEAEKPFDLPDRWEFVRLSELVVFENGDRSSRYPSQSDLKNEGIPFFGAKDMIDGELVVDNDLRFISEEKFSELSNGKLKEKDFVVLLRGTVGKIAQFNVSKFDTGFINAQMLIIRFIQPEMSLYFRKYFESILFENQISEFITGSAVKQMPASKLESVLVCVPPKEEQPRIVAKVNELMTLCDQLKTQLQTAQQTQIHLAQSISQEALA